MAILHLRQLLLVAIFIVPTAARAAEPSALSLMPKPEDYNLMYWAEGFPGEVAHAPWRRVIETGRFVFAFDTATLQVPHFGPLRSTPGYNRAARRDNRAWQKLPPADLALELVVDGRTYSAISGGKWTTFTGPRLVESGRFLQRADVTDLAFAAADGTPLNAEARFETVAWPDRLALVLAARPGMAPIPAGETAFGRVGGGFGLSGTNHLESALTPESDPERFTLELWAFVPRDYRVSERTFPWLVCKNAHEQAEGNYGIVILNGTLQARLNIGGGRTNAFTLDAPAHALRIDSWNHLALGYDGDTILFYVNGEPAGSRTIGRTRQPAPGGLAFGRRQDNSGDGYYFHGVIDEICLYDRALSAAELRQRFRNPENTALSPIRQWRFRPDGTASSVRPVEQWTNALMQLRFAAGQRQFSARKELPLIRPGAGAEWQEVFLALDPVRSRPAETNPEVTVQAFALPAQSARPVEFEPARGWHRVNLDGIDPILPAGSPEKQNDAVERVRLLVSNPTASERIARLLFEKTSGGIRQSIGSPITGISAVLRDRHGNPTGIPVQLSKNWHNRPEGGVYSGQWFHGFSQVRLPAESTVELELTLAYGHWGGVAAASHAQLCLIGWGSNQLWDQSAMGAWGESICYEPDQAQAQAAVLDVRPLMVGSMGNNQPWQWTHNVGGGDFFRLFDATGKRVPPVRMRTVYQRQGPCLTEVTYAGRMGTGIERAVTVSLARTDDLVRGIYHLRLEVDRRVPFSRFVLFQIGADSYSYTAERKMAWGNEAGLQREWETEWGGEAYRHARMRCSGEIPWVSLHEAVPRPNPGQQGAWANRGLVIRSWKARLGGRAAAPWLNERGVRASGADTSTVDLLPPPDVSELMPGDFVEAVIEHLVVPQFAADYYGPNESLRSALAQDQNTWRMVYREATGNDRRVEIDTGTLERLHPAITVRSRRGKAAFAVTGGLGYVPVTFTGLNSPVGHVLSLDGKTVDQSTHGDDFWQTDFDPATRSWSRTYNLPLRAPGPHHVALQPSP